MGRLQVKYAPVEFVMTPKGWHHLVQRWWEDCGQKKCQWLHP